MTGNRTGLAEGGACAYRLGKSSRYVEHYVLSVNQVRERLAEALCRGDEAGVAVHVDLEHPDIVMLPGENLALADYTGNAGVTGC